MLLKGKTKEQVEKERIEKLAQEVRERRNRLLAESDKYMLEDYPIDKETREKIKLYRKELRDLTKQEGFPVQIEWPILVLGKKEDVQQEDGEKVAGEEVMDGDPDVTS